MSADALAVFDRLGNRDMSARTLQQHQAASTALRDDRLAGLSQLAGVDIETPAVDNLSGALHALFDHVSEDTLPIYFGPLLGRLYLEGL